jgi:hypothetical protein
LFIEFPTKPQTSDQSLVHAISDDDKSGSDLRDFYHTGGTLTTS